MASHQANGVETKHDEEVVSRIHSVQTAGDNFDVMMANYKTWATQYDQDLSAVGYQGPKQAADRLADQKLPKDARILDVGAGTGLCAEILINEYGYTNIDALDASQDMLDVSATKNIYQQLHCLFLGDGHKLPFADNSYDAVIMAGALAHGHIKCDCFEELIRVIKPGGCLVNTMRAANRQVVAEYKNLDAVLQSHVDSGEWDKVLEEITPKYYMDQDAITWVFRIK